MDKQDPVRRRLPDAGREPWLTNKLAHAGLAGAVTTLIIFALNRMTAGEIAVPGELGAAATAAVMFLVGCVARERSAGPEDDDVDGGEAAAERRAGNHAG